MVLWVQIPVSACQISKVLLWSTLPPSLLQSLMQLRFRLSEVSVVDYVAPMVPRGHLRHLSRRFPVAAYVAPIHYCQAARRPGRALADADHFGMPESHAWDIRCCIQSQIDARSSHSERSHMFNVFMFS